jgi:phage antirepressor YoqD-like protein
MTNKLAKYERFDKDGIELVINTITGESFATISGYARMSDKDKSTISRRYQGVAESERKATEIQTGGGLQGVALIDGKLAMSWLAKDKPALLVAMGEVGWNVYCHKIAGYEVSSTVIEQSIPRSYGEALLEAGRLALENEKLEEEKKVLVGQKQLLETRNKVLKEDVQELRTTLIEKEPLVQLAETLIVHDKDVVTINEFAKAMKIGRNTMFDLLRKINFLQQDGRTPYQTHINCGRAEVYRKQRKHQPGIYDTVTVLTAKGQKHISKKLVELKRLEVVEVQMENLLPAEDF